MILYLNEGQEGGELRLWNEDGTVVDLKPEGAVAFLADEVEHEVLPSGGEDRWALTIWLTE